MSELHTEPPAAGAGDVGPVTARERIVLLDILRGIALLGVVIANVWIGFSGAILLFPEYHAEVTRLTLDGVVFNGIALFVSGKAATTFGFLFGLGFALHMVRMEQRGPEGTRLFMRRLAVLLLFGLTHAFFLWYGDILAAYALLGFVLLLFRRRTDRTILIWAAVLLAIVPIAMASVPLLMAAFGAAMPAFDPAPMAELRASALAAFQGGDPGQVFLQNLRLLGLMYLSPKALWLVMVLGTFLLGLYAGRRRFFENVEAHRAGFRRLAAWGLTGGLIGSAALVVLRIRVPEEALFADPRLVLLLTVFSVVGTVPLAFGYIATATLLLQRAGWRRYLGHFAPVGRMALTNYLSQTVICLLVFYGYGVGLIGQVGAAAALLIALLIFAVQMAWSPWWLARFHFGPAEWLWRSLTYGRWQPMRIRATVPAPAAIGPVR
jgi:uncharacterized protein